LPRMPCPLARPPIGLTSSQLNLVFTCASLLDHGPSRAALLEAFAARLPPDPSDSDAMKALREAMLVSDHMRADFEAELRAQDPRLGIDALVRLDREQQLRTVMKKVDRDEQLRRALSAEHDDADAA
jgi:hypothetical protein